MNTDDVDHDGEGLAAAKEVGPRVIARYLKHLPSTPGVYRMLDLRGDVIYVGKARSLKARVSNYTRLGGHTNRIARMIASTASMEFVTTATESEALLLEANLIKRFRPYFNVLMRDDKSFPYILISREHRAPQIMKHRGARNLKGEYFGPFASAGAVNRTLNMLQRAFLLRSCSDAMYESRTRPCLLYQIKRCSGPCTGEIELDAYGKLVDEAERFLAGKTDAVQRKLNTLMEEASAELEFERAARYRDRLWALAHVQATQGINPRGVEEADVFAAYQEGGQTCIQVFFFRAGQNWGNRAYFPRADRSLGVEEVLEAFIAQFYDDKPVPRCVFVSHEFPERALLAEALTIKAERKVEIAIPQRGEKAGLVAHALTNAREALGRKLADASSQGKLLDGVAKTFGLPRRPARIEVYDNSHIQGTNAVGAMIVAGPEGFVKNQYRKFNIKSDTLTPGDDYAMMKEVLRRRFSRLAKERAKAAGDVETPAEEALDAATAALVYEDAPQAPSPGRLTGLEEANDPRYLTSERGIEPATASAQPSPLEGEGDAPAPGEGAPQAWADMEGTGLDTTSDPEDDPALTEWAELEADAAETRDDPDVKKSDWGTPDLVLIDGGAGQLAAAQEVLAELGISGLALAGIAKGPDRNAGREHFFMRGRPSFMLEPRDPVLYFVQRLRDEAHRFAIGTHRAKRSKAIAANPLDEIAGVGAKRRRALLKHFGSAKAISRAGLADLQAVEGISAAMAQTIYDFFRGDKT
ncbi:MULTISPECIES: excinuclease ABC subunit UvrC [Rhodomicrobium]|uniref:excinuclease ABC subunit UvrC n=1 Tax=Rhodomicrobium TaxID=1068 RepID=UPI000B4BF67E|nr:MULTISPECIES: excinuclease ABC subunit UvrC [Rhodomicrobium]